MNLTMKKILRTVLLIGITVKLLRWIDAHVVNTRTARFLILLVILGALIYNRAVIWTGITRAAQLSIPNVFSPGDVISSSDMNANFSAVEQSTNNIEGEQIVNGSITAEKLASLSISSAMLQVGAVHREHLYSNVVYSLGGILQRAGTEATEPYALYLNPDNVTIELSANALAVKAIPDDSVTSAKIVDGTIVTADLADNSVTGAKIVDGTITTADCAASVYNGTSVTTLPGITWPTECVMDQHEETTIWQASYAISATPSVQTVTLTGISPGTNYQSTYYVMLGCVATMASEGYLAVQVYPAVGSTPGNYYYQTVGGMSTLFNNVMVAGPGTFMVEVSAASPQIQFRYIAEHAATITFYAMARFNKTPKTN